MEHLKPTYLPTVPRLLARFHDAVIASIHKSRIATMVYNAAYAYKKMLLSRFEYIGTGTWADRLVFGKIQAKMGGRLRALVSGSAPISQELLDWYRVVIGCQVLEG